MPVLSSNNKKLLLDLAAQSIKEHIVSGDRVAYENKEDELAQLMGCFVTLNKAGALRGCVGTFDAGKPLYENVMRMAVAAASQDRRFPPVAREELKDIQIEISVLGEPVRMNSFDEIVVGKHGVLVKHEDRSGTYLPQVAEDQEWTPVEFVTQCAREKAGLSPEECAQAEVYIYEVEKISSS